MNAAIDHLRKMDWLLAFAAGVLIIIGLLTLASLSSSSQFAFFSKQVIWALLGIVVFVGASFFDYRILRNYSGLLILLFFVLTGFLLLLLLTGSRVRGVISWFHVGGLAIEPGEFMKIVLIVILAKYFSRRHVEIYRLRHLVISGIYAAIPGFLVLIQPDLGTAMILASIWLGIVLFSGIRWKHLAMFFILGVLAAILAWFFVLAPYQQDRVTSFLNPWKDPKRSGYNAIQSMIAVGSGGLFGKGVGYGSQSHLNFLPESETDFIFAAFAEEWGFIGVTFLLSIYGILFWRLYRVGIRANDNFARLVILGVSTVIFVHLVIHVGMNTGLLPITGITLPLVSYGGSSLLTMLILLGLAESIAIRSLRSGGQFVHDGTLA